MQSLQALHVDMQSIDEELCDSGVTGPELAHLAAVYCSSPRCIVFRQPSSEWRLFMLLLPIASRLSLLGNPVFTQLTRAWGMNLRFVGIDRDGLVHDFRSLLSDEMLRCLIDWLRAGEAARNEPARHQRRATDVGAVPESGLDILFASLAREMLTVLDKRPDDWGRHLNTRDRLEPEVEQTLFDRSGRYPDFLASCREALRLQTIDAHFYGRVLRSIDLRERSVEQRAAAQIEDSLDPEVMARLEKSGVGKHLGCYNWLSLVPARAAARAHILANLPSFAGFFAESLLPLETWQPAEQSIADLYSNMAEVDEIMENDRLAAGVRPQPPAFDLQRIAGRSEHLHSVVCSVRLRGAVDAGQDRAVIDALADRFSVSPNTIRLLWHEKPNALGHPPTWHLAEILRQLDRTGRHDWPRNDAAWQALMARSVPQAAA